MCDVYDQINLLVNWSYNNIARSISFLDKIAIFVRTGTFSYKSELLQSANKSKHPVVMKICPINFVTDIIYCKCSVHGN